ncbi:5'-flap endonuclease [Ascosphaera aggregata]|nr:5'-flap endonuclease [Ascosphaera aggregata]
MQQNDFTDEQKETTTEDLSIVIPDSCPSTPEYVPSSAPSVQSQAPPVPRNESLKTGILPESNVQGYYHCSAEHANAPANRLSSLSPNLVLKNETEAKDFQVGLESQISTRQKLEFINLTDSPLQSASHLTTNERTEPRMLKEKHSRPGATFPERVTKSPDTVHPLNTVSLPSFSPGKKYPNSGRALKRHLDWTPVKDTVPAASQSNQSGSPDGEKFSANLFAWFKYDAGSTEAKANHTTTSISSNRTELLPVSGKGLRRKVATTTEKPSSTRRSRTTKKYSTITERATSKYRTPAHTIREFFHSSQEDSGNPAKSAATTTSNGKRKGRRKLASSSRSTSSLVAPSNAVESLNQQQWQFGTASQLSRDIAAAGDDVRRLSAASAVSDTPELASSTTPSITRLKFAASRGLWSAGARDLQGELQDTNHNDVITLSGTESVNQQRTIPNVIKKEETIDQVSVIYESDLPDNHKGKDINAATEQEPSSAQMNHMPNFDSYTASEIAEQLSKYSLKPIKARNNAIEMLKDCWLSERNNPADSTMDSQAGNVLLCENDGERSRNSTTPLPQMDKPRASSQAQAESEDPITSDLAAQLVRAIQSQPRPTGFSSAGKLTWHEKILLCDPISIDEFTLWLNTGGLNRVGEDREVSPLFVRSWCERRGICCHS